MVTAAIRTTEFAVLDGVKRCLHTWKKSTNNDEMTTTTTPAASASTPLVIIYHGFLAHGLYPTVRYAAELLSESGYTVVAADMRGHGRSDGLPGYIASADMCIADALAVAQYAIATHGNNNSQSVILLGSSMGGTIALNVAKRWDDIALSNHGGAAVTTLQGVVLLAPMLKLKVSPVEETILYALSCVLPNHWPLIPTSNMDASKQYRDESKRRECEDDPYTVQTGGKLRLGSVYALTQLVQKVTAAPSSTTTKKPFPVLLMVADEDYVVDSQGSLDYYQRATEKATATGGDDAGHDSTVTLKRYAALHGLLCESSPLVDTIQRDLLAWMDAQMNRAAPAASK
jgi:alpha-beta hydrolase superfamily lysophospholipase